VKARELVKTVARSATEFCRHRVDRGGGGGAGPSALDAGRRVIEATTQVARQARAGPVPRAKGLERIALAAAAQQLRTLAALLGFDGARTADAPPESSRADVAAERMKVQDEHGGFVSPASRALLRDEGEARMRAALGELIAETLALVDDVLDESPELGRGGATRWLHGGERRE
jgi:hypothetical protein